MQPTSGPAGARPLTVSQLNWLIRDTLEERLNQIWVVGEISNFRVPPSGHFYFALKDQRSQIAAVMFRSANQVLPFRPADGQQVIVRGRVGIYDVRGDLQLYVDAMEPHGLGSMQLALEQLKQRLAAQGLFASERKRALPGFPRTVGIVTALKGAAIQDMLVILRQRMPSLRIIVCPVRVQGAGAGAEIAQGLRDLAEMRDVEVIIVGRGGGSLEDLWAFNEERVALAIAASPVPVVSAVGHEIDVTIADLVADCRAPTPTAAASLVVPHHELLRAQIADNAEALHKCALRLLSQQRDKLVTQARRLRDPRQTVKILQQRLDELVERAFHAARNHTERQRQRFNASSTHLHALSPLAVLERGYSITSLVASQAIVRDVAQVTSGDELDIRFARGAARVRVVAQRQP